MGLLSKISGLEKKGKIGITLEKEAYYPGEIVSGVIYLKAKEPIECDGIAIKATGKEWIEWYETETRTDSEGHVTTHRHHREYKNDFYKEHISIYKYKQCVGIGKYAYPFQYQLKPSLPASFELTQGKYDSMNCQNVDTYVRYKIKATLDVHGVFSRDLKASKRFTIYPPLPAVIQPLTTSLTQKIKFLCCFNKGNCYLTATINKNAYFAGETAQIILQLNNLSKVNVDEIRLNLVKRVSFHAPGLRFTKDHRLHTTRYPGVPAGTGIEKPQDILITGNELVPPTDAGYVTCTYHINIECDIPWCPDVETNFPIMIMAPIPVGPVMLWVPQKKENYVTAV